MIEHFEPTYDVVVVGGGAAGLNGALMLGRSRRSVLVVDAGEPRNARAEGVHGFLTRDGVPPADLVRLGRAEVRSYGVELVDGRAVSASRTDGGFAVTLEDGRIAQARRLLVTTGLVDELPEVPGVAERWGRDVLHCPYCHGWEVRDRSVGVLATGPKSAHVAQLFRQLTDNVTVLQHDAAPFSDADLAGFAARGIALIDGPVSRLEVTDDRLTGVVLDDGTTVPLDALVVSTRMVARSSVLESLGVTAPEHPSGSGTYIESDPMGETSAHGVWVAGNVANPFAQVIIAAAAGAFAGAAINGDLVAEDVRNSR